MSSNQLRLKVLAAFKNLHKARLQTFQNDIRALNAARIEINENFLKNKNIQEPSKIKELIVVANDAADILRKHVMQMEQVGDDKNHFKLNMTKDTHFSDNTLYEEVSEEELLNLKKSKKSCKTNFTKPQED